MRHRKPDLTFSKVNLNSGYSVDVGITVHSHPWPRLSVTTHEDQEWRDLQRRSQCRSVTICVCVMIASITPLFDLVGHCNSGTVHGWWCCILHEGIHTQLVSCGCYRRMGSVFMIKLTIYSPLHHVDGNRWLRDEQEKRWENAGRSGRVYQDLSLGFNSFNPVIQHWSGVRLPYNIYTKDRNL